jgi:Zinc dependent phospholipase C
VPAVLTHKTIMLLARERLATIRDALNAKLAGAGPKSDLEHRVAFLADQAHRMMTDTALSQRGVLFPLGATYTTPLGQDVSPYAVMGSMGPDITAFSALFARGQGWVFDTVHKGNPDHNREPVVAQTTDFALEFWNQISGHAAAGRASADDVRNMRAYVMGHLCHIAGDVLSHPFINDLEWHLGNRGRSKLSHAGGEGSIDARVAQTLLLRKSTREGQDWDKWWPTSDEVPPVFYASYIEALDVLYRARSTDQRPKGFGEFEERFTERAAPAATLDFVKDGYHLYRHGIVSIGYGFGWGSWFGVLAPLVIPMSSVIGLAGALPHSREFFTKPWFQVGERGWFELLTLPLAVGVLVPIVYGTWLATLTTRGVGGITGAGLAFGWAGLIPAVTFFVTSAMDDVPWWARWFFLFAPLFIPPFVFACMGLADRKKAKDTHNDGDRVAALELIYGLPWFLWAIVVAGILGITMLGGLIPDLIAGIWGFDSTAEDVVAVTFFVVGMLLLTVVMIYLWIKAPKELRDAKIPEYPEPFPVDRPHFVRLFDDSTLFHDPALGAPTARELFYPSADRPLLKLWWSGAGDLYVRSEQRILAFSTTGTGAPTQRVPVPVTPMTVSDLSAFLQAAVPGLHADVVYTGDSDKEPFLPTGATFSEDVDESGKVSDAHGIPAAAFAWKKLEKTEAAAKYVLHHSDKPLQSVRFGQRGTVDQGSPQDEYSAGPGKITANGTAVTGTDTVFSFFFDPGDQVIVGLQARVVTQVTSDTQLVIASPFSPAVTSPSDYSRLGPTDDVAPCPGQVSAKKKEKKVTGTGTQFTSFFTPGDLILMGTLAREVTAVTSDTELLVGDEFKDAVAATDHSRVALGRERREGFPYVSLPATAKALGGGSVMDFAADFAALLCMGMAPHLLSATDRHVPTLSGKHAAVGNAAIDDSVGKVYQVFRNWSLDRRRLNEWRMIVSGGARSEKATADEFDAAMAQPRPPAADWAPANVVQAGEPVSLAQGWVPVLRQWMSRVAGGDVTSAAAGPNGAPSNLSLSQAMAFLLDLKAPTRLAP